MYIIYSLPSQLHTCDMLKQQTVLLTIPSSPGMDIGDKLQGPLGMKTDQEVLLYVQKYNDFIHLMNWTPDN